MSTEWQSATCRIRKAVDIDMDLQKTLSYQAIERGWSLKRYMEWGLAQIAEIESEKMLLEALHECDPLDILNSEEKSDFIRRLTSGV